MEIETRVANSKLGDEIGRFTGKLLLLECTDVRLMVHVPEEHLMLVLMQ